MSRVETVLIGTDDPFDHVVAQIARALGTAPLRRGVSTETHIPIDDTSWVDVEDDPLDGVARDEAAYESVTFELFVYGPDEPRQLAAARTLYDRLVATTSWKVVLLGPDDLPLACRPVLQPTT